MEQSAFKELLQRYLEGTCTEKERQLVEYWFEIWKEDRPESTLSEEEWRQLAPLTWNAICQQTGINQPNEKKIISLWQHGWLKIAASVAALLIFSAGFYFFTKLAESQESFRIANTTAKPKQLLLPDSSKVMLYSGARLQFPDAFAQDKREVFLEGDAFFEIVHQPQKPFYVKTNQLLIKVLGTSFWVRKTSEATVEVLVRTGRVAVSERHADSHNKEVVLTPNQKVTYYTKQKHFVTALIEKPQPVGLPEHMPSFIYKETPLSKVVEDLQKAYQVQIVLENPLLANCNLTGNLNQMDMYAQLEALVQAVGATYQIQGTTIFISGQGCP
ncbi:MAG: FecR domain-containing protein [Cytophagales bacterium]|nr:FecR domain-containing protein [Bernardetiaceae bacterium]MDW8210837.1 FecR domain-containing protein [Cytophagales bacterium]